MMTGPSPQRAIPFTTLADVMRVAAGRRIVTFGAGNISDKTRRLLPQSAVAYVVDNASTLWGTDEDGLQVRDPKRLRDDPAGRPFVLITTTSFAEVTAQLRGFGFAPGEDFMVSPVLNDLRIIAELESIRTRMLFSSGAAPETDPAYGGGLYELDVDGDRWTHRKVLSGHCYGIIRRDDGWLTVDSDRGILELDADYSVRREQALPTGRRGHGIAWAEEQQRLYVVTSDADSVVALDGDLAVVDQITVSAKYAQEGAPAHHLNDCCVVGNSLYVSMFSRTGNWKRDVFDGVVLEYDLATHELVGPVMTDLWMPHNISFHGGSLTVLDSLRGALRSNNNQIIGQFPAFARGLDFDGVRFYIGQSRNRNFSRNIGVSNNISIDAGIIVFDPETKVSRFLQLPPKVSEIHAIRLL